MSTFASQSFSEVSFLKSVFDLGQLPSPDLPEVAFAGRSNVGKSSLINRLVKRRNLVKTSSKPGKTQSLNYFLVGDTVYLVDLPGYGYARVSKKMQTSWQALITGYLESRETLKCVVVIVDLRHELKVADLQLVDWLRSMNIACILVYTKADKLSANQRNRNGSILDAGFGVTPSKRVIFSAKTGMGRDSLIQLLDSFIV